MTPNHIRLSPKHLFDILVNVSVTHIQMTPSLFNRWSLNEIQKLLNLLPLRTLIFGGECFPPTNSIAKWKNWNSSDNKLRLFNIYGLTEISCWSTMYEVTLDDIRLSSEIPIGTPLDDDTKLIVSDANENGLTELFIENHKRFTYQELFSDRNDNDTMISSPRRLIPTKDVVKVLDNSKYICCGRADFTVKRFGKMINLEKIRWKALVHPQVNNAYCHYDTETKSLLLFVTVKSIEITEIDVQKFLHLHLEKSELPDKIVTQIEPFALSKHGKIFINDLLSPYRISMKSSKCASEYFILKLNSLLNLSLDIYGNENVSKSKMPKKPKTDISFIHLGGTSVMAMNMLSEIESEFNKMYPELIIHLLNENVSITDIVRYLNDSDNLKSTLPEIVTEKSLPNSLNVKFMWKVNLMKCIDAQPTITVKLNEKPIVSVGSHSKQLLNVYLDSGMTISSIIFPDRIEGSISTFSYDTIECTYGVVGCNNGQLYCFNINTGDIKWSVETGGKIKCLPMIFYGKIYFGNYNPTDNLWCVNQQVMDEINVL